MGFDLLMTSRYYRDSRMKRLGSPATLYIVGMYVTIYVTVVPPDLRSDTALNEMLCDAPEFADEIDIPANFELTQPRHRVRRRNVNFDYEAREDPIEDPTLKYKAEFNFFSH
ncbi:uncharacterized protein TNCV_2961851 [Trichonephila clavipes]|nr:uncharacterized protein TNCV_2961851 [Trichonephila clavipes]